MARRVQGRTLPRVRLDRCHNKTHQQAVPSARQRRQRPAACGQAASHSPLGEWCGRAAAVKHRRRDTGRQGPQRVQPTRHRRTDAAGILPSRSEDWETFVFSDGVGCCFPYLLPAASPMTLPVTIHNSRATVELTTTAPVAPGPFVGRVWPQSGLSTNPPFQPVWNLKLLRRHRARRCGPLNRIWLGQPPLVCDSCGLHATAPQVGR